ncbi:MAG: hypothetical protein ACR2OB_07870 [Solirubrobacteraceae bacterium]
MQEIAGRVVLVPVGASLLARENLTSVVKSLATRYGTRSGVQRELRRCERRGASARNDAQHQVRRTRTRLEREVRSARGDLGQRSETISARVESLICTAREALELDPR